MENHLLRITLAPNTRFTSSALMRWEVQGWTQSIRQKKFTEHKVKVWQLPHKSRLKRKQRRNLANKKFYRMWSIKRKVRKDLHRVWNIQEYPYHRKRNLLVEISSKPWGMLKCVFRICLRGIIFCLQIATHGHKFTVNTIIVGMDIQITIKDHNLVGEEEKVRSQKSC